MARRILSVGMLAVFSWMIGGPTVAAAMEPAHEVHSASVHHGDGVPCPDGDAEGPCDDGCLCLCCPGHARVVPSPLIVSLAAPRLSTAHRFDPTDAVHPSGICHRIFRPPRV